jgi:hypothetical protein
MRQMGDQAADPADPWVRHMRRGEFEQAWRVSDAILAARGPEPRWDLPRHLQQVWNGSPLNGRRVLVRCYHGLGDTLQFIRYAPLLRRLARHVIVWAQPALIPLLRTAAGVDELLPLHDGVPECDYDVDVEIMELAHVFRSTLDTLPAAVPYLHAEPIRLSRVDGRLNVGVFWRAGDWDPRRSVPIELFGPLAGLRSVRLCVLQRDAAPGQDPRVHALAVPDDIKGTARVMRALDLVLTVDSMPAHLAGALAVPTWTLLQAEPDWRWMVEREDTPWYPTMRLFRQERAGDWKRVLERVADDLRRFDGAAAPVLCAGSDHVPSV